MGKAQTDQEETEYPHLSCCINLHAEDLFKNDVCHFAKLHMQAGPVIVLGQLHVNAVSPSVTAALAAVQVQLRLTYTVGLSCMSCVLRAAAFQPSRLAQAQVMDTALPCETISCVRHSAACLWHAVWLCCCCLQAALDAQ